MVKVWPRLGGGGGSSSGQAMHTCAEARREARVDIMFGTQGIYVELRLTLEKCTIEPIFRSNGGGTIYVTHKHKIVAVDSAGGLVEGKFLPSPILQVHQANLVVPTNKNKTCRMKVMTSFE